MKKNKIKIMPEYFDTYINETDDIDLSEALIKSGTDLFIANRQKFIDTEDKVYKEGKWTVKQILQHLIDSERIFCYRALRFARNDKTELSGYDENVYAITSDVNRRTIDELISDYESCRNSSINMYKSFTDEMLLQEGICFNKNISVLAIGFVLAGHTQHHINVIKDKYFPLIS